MLAEARSRIARYTPAEAVAADDILEWSAVGLSVR
jgi:hypothetical protein